MGREAKHPLSTAGKTLRIVELLQEKGDVGVTELAEDLGVSKGNTHGYLSTLEEHGFVVGRDGRYRLNLKFLEIGGALRRDIPLYRSARPEMRRLADESSELVNLFVEERGLGVYVNIERGPSAVELDTHIGLHTYLHTTALGKAILAYTPSSRVEDIIERRGLPAATPNSITTADALSDELQSVRERGVAVDDEERLRGLRCVAAPVLDENDDAIGAISVSGPTSRMKGEVFESDVPEMVSRAANVIEIDLKYA